METRGIELEHEDGRDTLGPNTLLVAIDDTGHEDFADPNYPVFGLGGCAVVVRDYERLISIPWNYMCSQFFLESQRPMHATGLQPSSDQLNALRHFFEKFEFFRLAATVSKQTATELDVGFVELLGPSILDRVIDVAKWAEFDRVFILAESSDRIVAKIMRSLSHKKISRRGSEIPIELGMMPKAASFPALEVADFIVHTAGTQTKARNAGNTVVRKDFEHIFRNVDDRLTSFMEITRVAPTSA